MPQKNRKKKPPSPQMAQRLFDLRVNVAGFTQAQVATVIEITEQAVSNHEAARTGVGLQNQHKYRELYGVSLAVIRGEAPIPEGLQEKKWQDRLKKLLAEAEALERKRLRARERKAARGRKKPSSPARQDEGEPPSIGEAIVGSPALLPSSD